VENCFPFPRLIVFMTKKNYTNTVPKIISGGQTGVDRGALDACLDMNFPCGGWCPKLRKAEDRRIPEKYPLTETPESDYESRTRKNILDSDGTLIISDIPLSGGTLLTKTTSEKLKKPFLVVSHNTSVQKIEDWITEHNIVILNVAGPRQSEWPEAYNSSYRLINQLIRLIRKFTEHE